LLVRLSRRSALEAKNEKKKKEDGGGGQMDTLGGHFFCVSKVFFLSLNSIIFVAIFLNILGISSEVFCF
jgi:hypothetical protein